MITVKATREGLIGVPMASGIPCMRLLPSVALPSTDALYRFVRLTNPLNGKTTIGIVLDVGPHHTHNNAYVFDGQRPQSETDPGSNGAGIDLSEAVWSALGMFDNTNVTWEFLA